MIRRFMRAACSGALVVIVALTVLAVTNRLADESMAPVVPVQADKPPSRDNGYVWMLGVGAPSEADQYEEGVSRLEQLRADSEPGYRGAPEGSFWCKRDERSKCLEFALSMGADRSALLSRSRLDREQWRVAMDCPTYVGLLVPLKGKSFTPIHAALWMPMLDLLEVADEIAQGRLDPALDRWVLALSDHRRMLAGARTLLDKTFAESSVDRDVHFALEWAESQSLSASQRHRLVDALKDLDQAEYTAVTALTNEAARLRQQALDGPLNSSWLHQPNSDARLVTDALAPQLALAAAPATQFNARVNAIRVESRKRRPYISRIRNPIGQVLHREFPDYIAKVARLNDLRALLAVARMRISGEAAIDPYTGRAFGRDRNGSIILSPRTTDYESGVAPGIVVRPVELTTGPI